jgi:uncharacterized metal-binding protein
MSNVDPIKTIIFNPTNRSCPIGEMTGKKNIVESKIPVLSCEGACIRGEIARLAANIVSKQDSYRRGCHGELITVPESAIAQWIKAAEKVVLIDGCFLRCHGRIIENIIDKEKLIQFDALSHYNRYTDIFDYDDVPEVERKEVAQSVANWVIESLNGNVAGHGVAACETKGEKSSGCCG